MTTFGEWIREMGIEDRYEVDLVIEEEDDYRCPSYCTCEGGTGYAPDQLDYDIEREAVPFEAVALLEYDSGPDTLTQLDIEAKAYGALKRELSTAQAVVREIAAAIEAIDSRWGFSDV